MKGRIVYGKDRTRYYVGGKEVSREEYDRVFPDQPLGGGEGLTGWKPLHSDALGVHPKKVKEAEQSAKAKGVPTEFDSLGRPVFTSRSHRRQYLRAYGYHDKHGGYGDG